VGSKPKISLFQQLLNVLKQWRAEGGANGVPVPGIQGRGGHPRSEITKIWML